MAQSQQQIVDRLKKKYVQEDCCDWNGDLVTAEDFEAALNEAIAEIMIDQSIRE